MFDRKMSSSKQRQSRKALVEVRGNNPKISNGRQKEKMILRSAEQTFHEDTIELKQFDPNFFSSNKIQCRFPGCKQQKERQSSTKEDLYLCPSHMNLVKERVIKMCKEKGVTVDKTKYDQDIERYTELIGWLEGAFLFFGDCPPDLNTTTKEVLQILQEISLNMRNVLMIINALLNPRNENLYFILPSLLEIVALIFFRYFAMVAKKLLQDLKDLKDLMHDVVQYIFSAFGIIYVWVNLNASVKISLNPGTKLGAGIGGFVGLGLIGALTLANPVAGAVCLLGGLLSGGLVGSGLYTLVTNNQELTRAYQPHGSTEAGLVFELTGSAGGVLELEVLRQFILQR
jgi:hypothetical protein